jgi:hypothetical protein
MIDDYFEFLKKVASKHPSVKKFRLIREFVGVKKGFIRFVIELMEDIKPSEEPTLLEILKKIGEGI